MKSKVVRFKVWLALLRAGVGECVCIYTVYNI